MLWDLSLSNLQVESIQSIFRTTIFPGEISTLNGPMDHGEISLGLIQIFMEQVRAEVTQFQLIEAPSGPTNGFCRGSGIGQIG